MINKTQPRPLGQLGVIELDKPGSTDLDDGTLRTVAARGNPTRWNFSKCEGRPEAS